jgi:iron complex transport system ATP-binding protein
VRAYLSQRTLCSLPFRASEVVRLGVDASEAQSGADEESLAWAALELCGVTHLAERLIDTLSGGEQQRVHWARVVAQLGAQSGASLEGKCLLLDEPISALDLAHQHEMLALARSLVARGCAVIAVLHDLNLSAEYGDRMLLLANGRIAAEGTPREVITPAIIQAAFGLRVRVEVSPVSGSPCVFVERETAVSA